MRQLILALQVLLIGSLVDSAFCGTIAIVTDQSSQFYAKKLKSLILASTCFRDLKALEIKIQVVNPNELNECEFNPSNARVMACGPVYARFVSKNKADKVVIVRDDKKYAGSAVIGGLGASVTTATPPEVGLHELLHAVGFYDEYEFASTREANELCLENLGSPNITYFKDRPPYTSDLQARSLHSGQIPWYTRINASTITTGSNLGSKESNKIGLYPAENCKLASSGVKAWRPGDSRKPNIMATVDGAGKVPDTFCQIIGSVLNDPSYKNAPNQNENGRERAKSAQ